MKCNTCGSEEHFIRGCPKNSNGRLGNHGNHGNPSTFNPSTSSSTGAPFFFTGYVNDPEPSSQIVHSCSPDANYRLHDTVGMIGQPRDPVSDNDPWLAGRAEGCQAGTTQWHSMQNGHGGRIRGRQPRWVSDAVWSKTPTRLGVEAVRLGPLPFVLTRLPMVEAAWFEAPALAPDQPRSDNNAPAGVDMAALTGSFAMMFQPLIDAINDMNFQRMLDLMVRILVHNTDIQQALTSFIEIAVLELMQHEYSEPNRGCRSFVDDIAYAPEQQEFQPEWKIFSSSYGIRSGRPSEVARSSPSVSTMERLSKDSHRL